MFARKKIIAVLVLVMLPALTCQAAWMRQEGEVSASTGVSVSDNGNFFDRGGSRVRNTCGTAFAMPIQAEYGASYYRTYFASTSLSAYNCGAGQVSGFTDFDLGVRGRVNVFANDQTWELAAIIPSYVNPTGAANQPKHFGIRFGFNSSDRVDPYQSFVTGDISKKNIISYGAGVRTWTGHIPNELSGYLGWGHTISDAVWADNTGGWYFSARVDGMTSFGKEHANKPGNGVLDLHDKYSLLTGTVALWHNLTPLSGIQFSLNQGLWGKNASSPSGIHIGYSKVWRD